ncbi:MAG TPA: hypothetical protein VGR61_11780 [Candidatus Dormibacteraeota bacterium]|nr:hypothetical protein [Candidatus Dormibacteraeota bacterium]
MHPLHVFIGRFDLQLPLLTVLVGAGAVVAASFGLIYLLPARPEQADGDRAVVPRPAVMLLQTIALAYLGFVIVVGLFGRQETVLNAALILFWVISLPGLPLLHCVVGGMYEVANPFALIARLVTSGGSARKAPDRRTERLGYWPAVVLTFMLFWFELAFRVVPSSPRALGVLAVVYTVFQVAMGAWLGEGWYRGGDVFQAMTNLASTIAGIALNRDQQGFVRLRTGFRPARFLPEGRGREALITIWLAGVLADGVRVTPIWKFILDHTTAMTNYGSLGAVDLGDLTRDTAEILFTWLAFGIFFFAFTRLAAALCGRDPKELARVVSPSLIPIALAYLFAHNLTQLIVVGPLVFSPADAASAQFAITNNSHSIAPALVFWVQVAAIVLGHVVAVIMAHARLARVEKNGAIAIRGDLGWLAAMVLYTGTSLWVLAQPITNGG